MCPVGRYQHLSGHTHHTAGQFSQSVPSLLQFTSSEGTTYYVQDDVYYSRVYNGGQVVYQVVAPPVGAIITMLPAGCGTVMVQGIVHHSCAGIYYLPVATGYQVVVF